MSSLYVVDTTVLSNFARVRRPDLLEQAIAPHAIIPPAVRQERELGESLGLVPRLNWHWLPVATLNAIEQALSEKLRARMDAGEAECLALAISRNGIMVTDDRGARSQATLQGITVTGTVGILRELVKGARLSLAEADEVLTGMIAQGFYSPVRSLKQLMP
jgi:predicted nucleic acid-binding protein